MGECFITRRGGESESYKVPILDPNYPMDVSLVESENGIATFEIKISKDGFPATYTYQWYLDNKSIPGANSDTYSTDSLTQVTAETLKIYCEVTNEAGTVTSRTASLDVLSALPEYTYEGEHQLIDDGNYNWRIKFKSSGTLNFTNLGSGKNGIDVFLVGGGGGGDHGGGGGGFTTTATRSIESNTDYKITIGAGGSGSSVTEHNQGTSGGNSEAFGYSAMGGSPGSMGEGSNHVGSQSGGNGGSGGGCYGGGHSGGSGGSDGKGGQDGYYPNENGTGQDKTTREFEAIVTLAYIVDGQDEFSKDWLALEPTDPPLVPIEGHIYSILEIIEEDNCYQYKDYIWNGEQYEETDIARVYAGGGGGSGAEYTGETTASTYAGGKGGAGGGGKGGKPAIHAYDNGWIGDPGKPNTGGGGGSSNDGGSGIVIIRNYRQGEKI